MHHTHTRMRIPTDLGSVAETAALASFHGRCDILCSRSTRLMDTCVQLIPVQQRRKTRTTNPTTQPGIYSRNHQISAHKFTAILFWGSIPAGSRTHDIGTSTYYMYLIKCCLAFSISIWARPGEPANNSAFTSHKKVR